MFGLYIFYKKEFKNNKKRIFEKRKKNFKNKKNIMLE